MKFVEVYDDLDWTRDRTKTLATNRIVIEANDRSWGLDLSDANFKLALGQMRELIEAGTEVHTSRKPAPAKKVRAPGFGHRSKFGRALTGEHAAIREWVDANRISHPSDPERPAYLDSTGRLTWPKWLVDRYRAENPVQAVSAQD